jgi:hypothetical protein
MGRRRRKKKRIFVDIIYLKKGGNDRYEYYE